MARIALRAYNREIEHLIEGGQIEEAIAHCRHIFKYFPKHIHTYRLLGKAYLETQRYGDAADILQRVLSSIPDDFISHLGMSIIREDEGNLDEAIWHMERAFEVQPANRAIQDELRRLHGRRDGLEPPKIRLTRGALARMYAKGELYPQAIAELRAALADDPQRLDLQVVLAEVYARAGQRIEAASICNGLLRKLPYCLTANEVMADILADSERSEEARLYRQRAQALDAYLAHTSPAAPTADRVPDIAVTLERLAWQPGKSIEGEGQPDWAASLGIELESSATQKEEIPDWLSAVQPESDQAVLPSGSETSVPFTDEAQEGVDWMEEVDEAETGEWDKGPSPEAAQPSTDEEIPEWMKTAGWSPAAGEVEEEPAEFEFSEEDFRASQPEGELEGANLPEWLREIAPENLDQDTSADFDEAGWDQGLSEDAAILESTPDWFKESDAEAAEEEESPDWLAGLAGEAEASAKEETTPSTSEDLPDWLQEMEAEAGPTQEDQIPDWLQETEPETEQETLLGTEVPDEVSETEELPDWLTEPEAEEAPGEVGEVETEPADEVPDWLKEMEVEAGATIISEPEAEIAPEKEEALPDWLQELEPSEVSGPIDQAEGVEAIEAEAEPDEEPPDRITSKEAESVEEVFPEPQAEIEQEPAEEFPDWLEITQLEEIKSGADSLEETTPAEELPFEEEEPVAELAHEAEIEPEAREVYADSGEEEAPQEAASLPEEMDSEAAFAWLESLAARQGAKEEDLLLRPEERAETPPDWIKSAMEVEAEGVEQVEAPSEPAQEEISEQEEIPAGQEQAAETVEQEAPDQAEALPDWLQEIDVTTEEDITGEEPLPDWLQEAAVTYQEEYAEPEEELPAAEEIPDWLKSMQLEEESALPEAEKAEELPDWLREVPEEIEEAPAEETQIDWLAELEEPIIEGDTKPTLRTIEAQEKQISATEDSPTEYVPPSEVEEELPRSETEVKEPELEEQAEQTPADETDMDIDAGFAWLESLAAKQGADEGMLLAPEERLESPPEWIQSALDRQFGEEAQGTVEEAAELEEEQIVAAVEQPVEEEEVAEIPEQAEEAPELPDWLVEVEAEAESDETAEVIDAIAESATVAEEEEIPELPIWLEEAEEKEEPSWTPPEPDVQKLDLNQASLAELERLPGVGFILAQQIVTYREQNGPFSNLNDLEQISGVTPAMLADIEDLIMVETAREEPLSLPVETGTPPELVEARQVMLAGSLDEALEKYSELILQKKSLSEVIYDLNQILLRHDQDADVWQTLGDAQMRANLVQDALESYTRAEQLFR